MEQFLETAVVAAQAAGQIIIENLGKLSSDDISQKQASDFVTRTDKDSEACIVNIIRQRYPYHRVLAEESAEKDLPGNDYRWIIDPLDGTTNYIHQFPAFCVSIALEFQGRIVAGVIFDPLRKELFSAGKGSGAFLNGGPIEISGVDDPAYSLVATGFPFRKKDFIDAYMKLFKKILFKAGDLRRAGSAALDLAYVAAGRL